MLLREEVLTDEVQRIWEHNADWWDDQIGDGSPATHPAGSI